MDFKMWLWSVCWGLFMFISMSSVTGVNGENVENVENGVNGDIHLPECLNCTLYNRQQSLNDCARSFSECGGCIEGYDEVPITNETKAIKPCKKRKRKEGYCDVDDDCTGAQYCFYHQCKPCFDCRLYNRSKKSRCATGPGECGPCSPGFHEIPKTRDASIAPCKQERYAAFLSSSEGTSTATVGTVAVISVTFLAAVIFGAFLYVVVKRRILVNRMDEEDLPMRDQSPLREPPIERYPPPSYSEANREDSRRQDFGSSEEFTTFFTETKELVNEAICFRHPTAPYYPPAHPPPTEEEAEVEVDNQGNNPVPEFQPEDDEATLPSNWTPNTSTSNASTASDLCNFSGLFPSSSSNGTSGAEGNIPLNISSNRNPVPLDESGRSTESTDSNNPDDSSDNHQRETRC